MDEYNPSSQTDNSSERNVRDVKRWLERVTRRSMGDVRVHDSSHAGQLARRLGARAFTAGRHVYVRPELVHPARQEGMALLAHEIWHAAGEPPIVSPDVPMETEAGTTGTIQQPAIPGLSLPLLAPRASRAAQADATGAAAAAAATGAAANSVSAPAAHSGAMAVQRAAPPGASASESGARSVEAAAMQSQQRKDGGEQPKIDPEQVAEKVYQRLVRELILDNERHASGWF